MGLNNLSSNHKAGHVVQTECNLDILVYVLFSNGIKEQAVNAIMFLKGR